MIYGQDEPMLFPVADLYDSGMMQMYINAAKEQYNQNREDMKEFMKTYGDFMSPLRMTQLGQINRRVVELMQQCSICSRMVQIH